MRPNKLTRAAFVLAATLFCANFYSVGQSTTGGVTGVVTDPAGAVIPGAKVTLVNPAMGTKLQTVTDAEGIFNFRNLPVGTYSVETESNGFTTQERTGLQLYANQTVTADMRLGIIHVNSNVVVTTAPSVLDTQNSSLASVIPGGELEKMPVLTRQHGDIGLYGDILFNPGVSIAQNISPPINGVRSINTMDTMDGMTVMAYVTNEGGGPVQPSLEAIQEIHSVLADAPAEFWRSAAITVVTKSGTNQLHGSLFEDYNGDLLNAKSFFASQVPFRVYNDFGGSIGGPIKKDKLFYFGDYEGSRESAQRAIVGETPLPAWRTGDFSSLNFPITNPYTGAPFPGNQIPVSMISPVSTKLQALLYPQPNYGPPGLLSGNYRNLIRAQNGFTRYNNFDVTLDYNWRTKDTLFVRDSYRELPVTGFYGNLPNTGPYTESRLGSSGVIEETHMFSPSLANEARLGYTDMNLSYSASEVGLNIIQQAGIQGIDVVTPVDDVPHIIINSISPVDNLPATLDHGTDVEWNDNLSWTPGRHLLKFGVDQIFDTFNGYTNPSSIYGGYQFLGQFTGFGYADFLLGLPHLTSLTSLSPVYALHGILLGAYAQDVFQVNQRLTLNYGVRYEYQGPYSDANRNLYSFDPKTGAEVLSNGSLGKISKYFPSNVPVETAATAGYPSGSLMRSPYFDFYPRAGFNYRLFPNRTAVLRGGFGIYANNVMGSEATDQTSNGGPLVGSATFINQMVNGEPLFSFPEPFLSAGALSTQTVAAVDPNVSIPYTDQWNLTLEQQLGSSIALKISYVGDHTGQLIYPSNLDQPAPSKTPFSTSEMTYPIYNSVLWGINGGRDNYNALQVTATKTYGQNIFLNTGLTWAKGLSDVSGGGGDFEGTAPENRYCLSCEYGNNPETRRLIGYLNSSFMLPFGRGQHFLNDTNRWLNGVIGGWNMAWVGMMASGSFFTPEECSGFDTANTNTSFCQRPDLIGNPHVSHPSRSNWFNINAYAIPGCPIANPLCNNSTPIDVGRFGNTRPNTLAGPHFVNFDVSLNKDFSLGRQRILEFRLTSADAFNHVNYGNPDPTVTDGPGVAGVITGLSGANFAQATLGAREVDIFARIQF